MEPRPLKHTIDLKQNAHLYNYEDIQLIFLFFRVCTGVPEPPADVTLHVTSNRSLTVSFTEPQESNGAVVTRYKSECMVLLII